MREPYEFYTKAGCRLFVQVTRSDSNTFASVKISGKFAVRPESARAQILEAIAHSIEGQPILRDPRSLAAYIQAAIPFGIELQNVTPDEIARAVQAAVAEDTATRAEVPIRIGSFREDQIASLTESWKRLPWRLIPERSLPPAVNVALDEWLSDQLASGACPPTLRFWCWSEPAVIIGRCQSVTNEIDRDAAAKMGVQVVRRMTGGGAMFVQPHGAITYSVYLPEKLLEGLTIRQSYEVCDAWVIRALRSLGVDAHHVPVNDIACADGKIGGAAQARRKGVVLHHTTIAYAMDVGEMARVLRIGREKLRERAVASAAKRVSPLLNQTSLPRDEIVAALMRSFQNEYGGQIMELKQEEREAGMELAHQKYASHEWTEDFG